MYASALKFLLHLVTTTPRLILQIYDHPTQKFWIQLCVIISIASDFALNLRDPLTKLLYKLTKSDLVSAELLEFHKAHAMHSAGLLDGL